MNLSRGLIYIEIDFMSSVQADTASYDKYDKFEIEARVVVERISESTFLSTPNIPRQKAKFVGLRAFTDM